MSLWDTVTSNPLQMAAVVIAILSIATTITIFYKNRKIKSFSYSLLTNAPLLTVDEELSGKVKIYYEESPDKKIEIKDSSLVIIKFVTDGNESIRVEDFEGPITISFQPQVDILSAKVIKTDPPTLEPKLNYSNNSITIEPLLLNEKDTITIKVLVTGWRRDTKILPSARIADIHEIKNLELKTNYRGWVPHIFTRILNGSSVHLSTFTAVIAIITVIFTFSMNSLSQFSLSVSPTYITAPIGGETETIIHVSSGVFNHSTLSDPTILMSSVTDNQGMRPNITITFQPTTISSPSGTSKMKIRIGPDVKPGMYGITTEGHKANYIQRADIFLQVTPSGN